MSRTRAALTALSLIPVLLVAGCSDDDPEPKFGPTPSETPTSSSSSAPGGSAAPTMPPGAQGADAASAEVFVEFYWDTVNYAQESGDLEALQQLADPKCEACKGGVEYLEGVFRADGRITGGVATLGIQKSILVQDGGQTNAVVKFVLTTTPQLVNYPGTEKDESYPGGRRTVNALVRPSAGSWAMGSWGVQK